ncbi:tetratricopeptide repeat protein 17 [Caerostris darwini]|uniref:Tetratricopeptide repeat protein 17 n=1 Tax=Caerostris darwini TaxID=1538125 RepID=A0AAV4PLE7_9ARAC|nr:tetratricopeptide repeat protein 17 [Caerostris darwini]
MSSFGATSVFQELDIHRHSLCEDRFTIMRLPLADQPSKSYYNDGYFLMVKNNWKLIIAASTSEEQGPDGRMASALGFECRASTHWIVTEDGRIQPQLDSVYSLKRPYDLVALIQQEKRAVVIEDLKQQLMKQKEEIDRREDKETNLEGKIYATDEDCVAAEKPLTDFDLYASTVVPFPPYKEFGDDFTEFAENIAGNVEYQKPNCTEIIDLDFSMNAFEHLVGVRDRHNLTMTPEMGLQHAVTTVEDIDLYGHLVHEFLQKNRTSWILFNMAAYYWRIQGNATNAIECVRRALHYSPREFKDISLINLGNILHLSHLPEEAAIVVHAAVDVAPTNAICHFTLGNIYAVLADYNKSSICFDNALQIQPDFTNAAQRYHAVMCHDKLETALESQHINLQNTLTELREYQKQHQFWVKEHEKLLSEQAPPEVKLEQRLEYEEQKIRESLDGRGMGSCSHSGECCGLPILFTVVPPS